MESPLIPWALILFIAGFLLATDHSPHRKLYYLLVFLPFVLALNKSQWQALLRNPIVAATGLLLAYLLITLFWSPNVDVHVVYDRIRWAILALSFVMVVAFVIHRDPRWHEKLTLVLAPSAIIVAAYSLYHFTAEGNTLLDDRLYNVLFYHDNPIRGSVAFAVSALLCAFLLMERIAGWKQALAFAGLIASVGFLYLAQSRGLLLGTTAGIGAALALHRRWAWLAAFAGLGAMAIGFTELSNTDIRGFLSRADTYRLDIWSSTVLRIMENPVFGEGLTCDRNIYVPSEGRTFHSPHNVFLMSALHGGIIALLLLCSVYAAAIREALRSASMPATKLGIVFLVYGTIHMSTNSHEVIDSINPHFWLALWLPLGIMAATALRMPEEHDNPS